jgi:hypothetical protein
MSKTSVVKQTIELFGPELGGRLLDRNAIVPVRANKQPAVGIRDYNNGVDLSRPFGPYDGLAIINGAPSGILTVDLDRQDLYPPVDFNVETTKGGHIYLPWSGERRKTNFAPGVDVLGAGGYSIFTGPGRSFVSPAFADATTIDNWLTTLTPHPLKSLSIEDVRRGYEQRVKGESVSRECITPYPDKVRNHGYELRLDTINKTYVTQMRTAPVGTRNERLFIGACELYKCGGDIGALMDAAHEAGLPWPEIENTVGSAEASLEFKYDPKYEMLERVQVWLNAHQDLPPVMCAVAMHLAFEAVAVNSTRPLLSQSQVALEIGKTQGYVSQTLRLMETEHRAVIRHANPGSWGTGLSHCNNYELTIDGRTI